MKGSWKAGKCYRTKFGSQAIVYEVKAGTIVGAIWDLREQEWVSVTWTQYGFYSNTPGSKFDLTDDEWLIESVKNNGSINWLGMTLDGGKEILVPFVYKAVEE